MESIDLLKSNNLRVIEDIQETNARLRDKGLDGTERKLKVLSNTMSVINRRNITDKRQQQRIFNRINRNL